MIARLVGLLVGVCFALIFVIFMGWFIGSSNPDTPAGYVGYLTQGAVMGKKHYVGLQTGPASPGRTWMLHAVNVSITPYTFTESFGEGTEVLSKDNLKISFQVHVLFKIKPEMVQEFVEKYSALDEKKDDEPEKVMRMAYDNFMKQPLRTFARDEVQKLNGLDIKDRISEVGAAISHKVQNLTKETPFDVMTVVVGNIQYPPAVSDAVSQALAATQVLERKKMEIHIAEQEKKKRVVEAEGIAEAMRIINNQLTPSYLQHEAIEAQKAMVGSPNHTTIYIPIGPMGVPLVGTLDGKK